MWGRSGRSGRIQGSRKRKEIVGHTTDDRFSVSARVLARERSERVPALARSVRHWPLIASSRRVLSVVAC